jgi:fused signal recognition particle receptor
MRDESHLDDMRSAIRGDFDRLAQRRGTQELMNVADEREAAEPAVWESARVEAPLDEQPAAEPSPEADAEPELAPEADAAPEFAARAAPEADVAPEREPEVPPEPEEPAPPRRSWLDRLLGR